MAIVNAKRRFATVAQIDVPQGRNGKHKRIVSAILAELAELKGGDALKIALDELNDSKENVRSALNRASHKLERPLATAADDKFLYVWSTKPSRGGNRDGKTEAGMYRIITNRESAAGKI